MAIRGVSDSELVRKSIDGDRSQIPIGQTILTNTVEYNSPDVKSASDGRPVENLGLDQFTSKGRESLYVNRNDSTNTVKFDAAKPKNAGKIVEIAFDKESGSLNIVKQNQEIVKIDGFLTQADFGVGPTGPTGIRGNDGPDGDDGYDGPAGWGGCKGPDGPVGDEGLAGKDGKDGDVGPKGPPGPQGEEGPQGEPGPPGQLGFEGSRGFRGDGCNTAEEGEQGIQGLPLNTSVVVSSEEPDNLSVLWGLPV